MDKCRIAVYHLAYCICRYIAVGIEYAGGQPERVEIFIELVYRGIFIYEHSLVFFKRGIIAKRKNCRFKLRLVFG